MVKHVSNNINKGKKALGLIRYAAGLNIKLSSLISLVRATVLSRLDYGGHICCPISDAQFGRMDKILNQALRIVSGATSKISGEAIQYYLGFHSMKEVHKLKATKELVRALTTDSRPLNSSLRGSTNISCQTVESICKE